MSNHPLRILLVDDDYEDYLITRGFFESIEHARYQLDWVDTYDKGLEVIEQRRHDVYILDYRLGGRSGITLLKEAKARGCRAPIIMLTGQGSRDVDLEAMRSGASDYLVKGHITAQVLERSIRYAIQHAKSTEALRMSVRVTNLMSTAVNSLDIGVVITDPLKTDNPVVYISPGFAQLTGYTREDLMGRNLRLLQGPDTNVEEVAELDKAMERVTSYKGVQLNYRKSGEAFWNEISLSPVRDEDGKLANFVAVMSDVSERVHKERVMQASGQLIEELLDGSTLPVLLVKENQVTYSNPALSDFFESAGGLAPRGPVPVSEVFGDDFFSQLGDVDILQIGRDGRQHEVQLVENTYPPGMAKVVIRPLYLDNSSVLIVQFAP